MKKLILALAAFALSGVAVAGPSWTYVDLGYVRADSGDNDADAYGIAGSFGFGELFHVNAVWVDGTDSDDDDFDSYRIGAGLHPAVTDDTDLVLEIGYATISSDDFSNDPSWVDLTLGVRSMITDRFELNAAIVTAVGDDDIGGADGFTEVGINIGGQYFFNDAISINVVGSDEVVKFGVRWSFGDLM